MWGTVGRIWRTYDQFWGSLKKTSSRPSLRELRGVVTYGKCKTEVAQQLVNDSRQKEQSLTNEITLVPRRMRGEDGREKEKGNPVML
jgi:hypothetical protein